MSAGDIVMGVGTALCALAVIYGLLKWAGRWLR